MFKPDLLAIEKAKQHAIEAFPTESVGMIVAGARNRQLYVRLTNIADDPEKEFLADRNEIIRKARGREILMIIHSHPGGPLYPSKADMACQMSWDIPFAIIASGFDSAGAPVMWGGDLPRPPLYSRTFMHGVTDCYSFVRDWYLAEFGIDLPDHAREDDWWSEKFDEKGKLEAAPENLYVDNFGSAGFHVVPLEEIERGDVILLKVKSKVANHAAIYLGGDRFGHHMNPGMSEERAGLMIWQRQITHVLRHESRMGDE